MTDLIVERTFPACESAQNGLETEIRELHSEQSEFATTWSRCTKTPLIDNWDSEVESQDTALWVKSLITWKMNEWDEF